ncbi:hypothetical protein [Acidipila rosea]|uniref:Uncharacterized protein n=1 Tax=Acidipila rosea TaxID=768535 RepID=A0A4R1L1A8_9BACT|nr:hypothetical protein [Acidipila rosea]TCK71715.1 hypothetical protein C7378_3005 [Acidipila rosea]
MRHRLLIFLLLTIASLHCGSSIFYSNVGFINMQAYEGGQERMPFQSRALMMPVMRWARQNALLKRRATHTNDIDVAGAARERQTPERLLSSLIARICVLGLGILATLEGKRLGIKPWWLPWAVVLEILFVCYVARSAGQDYWYPYDFPQFLLFGVGSVLVLRRKWVPLLLMMPVMAANRETSIFLALLWFAAEWGEANRWRVITQSVALGTAWLLVQIYIYHLFKHNMSVIGNRFPANLMRLTVPTTWPQILSAFGFLWPFLWLYRKLLSPRHLRILYAMVPRCAVVLWFGIWTETRIFGEFTLLSAIFAAEMWTCSQAVITSPAHLKSYGRREQQVQALP